MFPWPNRCNNINKVNKKKTKNTLGQVSVDLKGQFTLPVVLIIHLDCFGVRCRVLKILAVEMTVYSGL